MDNLPFYLENWYIVPKAIFRLCFIFINNVYCIPTYVIWMILLMPLRKLHPDTYWKIEGYFFIGYWRWYQCGVGVLDTMGREVREQSIKELVSHLLTSYHPRNRKWLVLFPEGGFLRKRKAISQKYAAQNNLPLLNNVSLPRVGALQAIMQTIGPQGVANNNSKLTNVNERGEKLTWVLDITIAYPNGEPLDLMAIVFGHKAPCMTTIFYRLYNCEELPAGTEALTQWLYDRFEDKEKMLDTFYKTGQIPVDQYSTNPIHPHVVAQDCLRFLILHLFFITSSYLHFQIFMAAYNYYNYLMY